MHQLLDPLLRLDHELRVTGAQYLVEQENVRLDRGGDREAQPDLHAARVGAHRHLQIFTKPSELGDLVCFLLDLAWGHAIEQAACIDIFQARVLDIEPDTEAQQ